MKRAKFTHKLTTQGSRLCLVITDLRLPTDTCLSVTQDIERVVEQIETTERIHAENFIIIYRDTQGVWDGWNAHTQKFVLLAAPDWPAAVVKYIQEALQPQHA